MLEDAQGLVRSFYADVWNRRDAVRAREILSPDFRFRGSLGPEKHGVDGFLTYVDAVHFALGDYTCTIEDLIGTPQRVAARMTFRGIHQNDFFGIAATHKSIQWAGAAFFIIRDGKIVELWVLGDIDSIKAQLGTAGPQAF